MQLLFNAIIAIVTAIRGVGTLAAEWFGMFYLFIVRKYAVVMATISALVVATAAMILCLKQLISSISALLNPPMWLLAIIQFITPTHMTTLVAAVLSAKSCRAAYDYAVLKFKLINGGS